MKRASLPQLVCPTRTVELYSSNCHLICIGTGCGPEMDRGKKSLSGEDRCYFQYVAWYCRKTKKTSFDQDNEFRSKVPLIPSYRSIQTTNLSLREFRTRLPRDILVAITQCESSTRWAPRLHRHAKFQRSTFSGGLRRGVRSYGKCAFFSVCPVGAQLLLGEIRGGMVMGYG